MTRIYSLPRPDLDEPQTQRQQDIQSIRRRLSHVAALLTQRPERVNWAVGEVEGALGELRELAKEEEVK